MAVCLSAAEIGTLAGQLGLAPTSGRSTAQAAHEVVKAMDRGGRLDELLATLRQVRPLVEWPEPGAGGDEAVELSGEALVDDFAPTAAGYQPPNAAPSESAAASSRRGPAAFAPEPGQAPSPFDLPPGAPSPAAPPSAAAPWPSPQDARYGRDARPPRGLDARILVAVAGLMVVAVGIAFAAGRVSSPEATESAAAASASAPASAAARRPDGVAVRAADAVSRSLDNVSRACALRGVEQAEVLEAALAECGPGSPARRPRGPLPGSEPAPTPTAEAPAPVGAVPRAGTPDPTGPGGPCLSGCDASHGACRAACGPEPQHATEYAPHQQCLAKCLATASKCRLGCQ